MPDHLGLQTSGESWKELKITHSTVLRMIEIALGTCPMKEYEKPQAFLLSKSYSDGTPIT